MWNSLPMAFVLGFLSGAVVVCIVIAWALWFLMTKKEREREGLR